MKQKLVILIAGKRLSQLLQSPIGSRMFGDIEMDESPRPDLHSHEYIQETEACGHGNKEVAGYHLMGMIPQKGRPALILTASRARQSFDILADCASKYSD